MVFIKILLTFMLSVTSTIYTAPRTQNMPCPPGCNRSALLDFSLYIKHPVPSRDICNTIPVFSDSTGTCLKSSGVCVDDEGNIQLIGIIDNGGEPFAWPPIGGPGTFLGVDDNGELVFEAPAGNGDVAAAVPFGTDNKLISTDLFNGPKNVKETDITVDSNNNMSGINTLTATTINANITGTVTGAASDNVLKTGDTMSGALELPAGSAGSPSLTFTSSPGTGLFANSGTLSLSTNGTECLSVGPSCDVSINNLATPGVVHNDANGTLSTSLIVNADIDAAAGIVDTKLATISTAGKVANAATTATSANVANTIVERDGSGNFDAGIVNATLAGNVVGNASGNVLKAGDTMTGTLQLPAGSTAAPALSFTGSTTTGLSANSGNLLLSTNGAERLNIASSGTISVDAFTSAGVVHNNASGNLSTSLIVNADVAAAAGIIDTKLATISTAGKIANSATTATPANTANTIVARDGSNNFQAGTISADLIGTVTGSASQNVLKTGDTMTGNLQLPAGTTGSPALKFSGSTNTGISAPSANALSFDTNGTERMQISPTGVVTVNGLNSTGIVHTDAAGNFSTSLISNSDITNATISNTKLATISSTNTSGNIVVRDGAGDFAATMITLTGTVSNPTDVATKAYVDTAVSLGLVPKTPTVVVSTSNLVLSGTQTIDGVSLVANDRVLLVGQTNPIENGLWLVQVGAWTRPTDFASGSSAGQAYVLITSGTSNAGSSWLSNTPTAIVDTDPLMFVQFSIPGQTTGANVGAGDGQLFKNKTGITLNFKSLAAGAHITATNNSDDVTLTTDATPANTINTIVARDSSGNFVAGTISANLTGSASNNVLKAGDSMTGTLNMQTQNAVRFQDAAGGEFVGLHAPAAVGASYTLELPIGAPTALQSLRANNTTPTQLEWFSSSSALDPAITGTIEVSVFGNDITGDGSADAPFASLAVALNAANALASLASPLVIHINPGIYIEDNSAGPLAITADGISIVGDSATAVSIRPLTLSNDLLLITKATRIAQISMTATGVSVAAGIVLNGGSLSAFSNLRLINFQTGISCFGTGNSYGFNTCLWVNNGVGIAVNDCTVQCQNCTILGAASLLAMPAHTGITATGAQAKVLLTSGTFAVCSTACSALSNAQISLSALDFRRCSNGIIQTGGSNTILSGCTFSETEATTDIALQASGAGTIGHVLGCTFDGRNNLGVAQATGIVVTDDALVRLDSGSVQNYTLGIQLGDLTDTSTTQLIISSFTIRDCATDILQQGSTHLDLNASIVESSGIIINDPTNVSLAYFDLDNNSALTIGSLADVDTRLIQAAISPINPLTIQYKTSLYGTQAIGFENQTGNAASLYVVAEGDANLSAITTDRTEIAGIRLASDTGVTIGTTTAFRGWNITKNSSTAQLAFNYQNSDIVGQAVIPSFTLLQLDGVNNQLQLPNVSTQLMLGSDTNLYRSAANTLKTDGNLVIGTLTGSRVLVTDGASQLIASTTTATELGYLSGVTTPLQTQLNAKLNKAGDIMTGALQIPAGAVATPSLTFTGSTTAGLSANSGTLSLSTAATERLKISPTGTVSVNALNTVGVVHNNALGDLSTSLIVNADIDPSAAISDTKLATISVAGKVANSATTATNLNVNSAIVARDLSGNFNAGTITANLSGNVAGNLTGNVLGNVMGNVTGSASLNVLKAGDTMTGPLQISAGSLQLPTGSIASPALKFAGSLTTGLCVATPNLLSLVSNGTECLSLNDTQINMLAKVILSNVLCYQGIQTAIPANNTTVNINAGTSILILKPTALVSSNFTLTFPPSPTHGQRLTIVLGSPTFAVSILYNGNGASIINAVAQLSTTLITAITGGISACYFYNQPDNTWYRDC